MKGKPKEGWALCRPGNHMVRRNVLLVTFEPGVGICGRCVVQRTAKIRDYWTKGRALDSPTDAQGVASGHIDT